MKKISVIIPVYNAEEFLGRCIESVINQTLKDIEIILINDGSNDNSQKIIDTYKMKFPNIIKSKTIKNSGASNARNIGIEMAEGEYIGFVDSDDYIDKTMYEKLYNKSKKENSDIVVSGYFVEKRKNIRAYQNGHMEQYDKNILENPNIFIYGVPYLWNKIFKRSLILENNIKLDNDLDIFEDLNFVYKVYIKANKISKVNEPLYYYIKENESSLTSKFSDKFFDIFPAIQKLKRFYKENDVYEELEDHLIYIALNHMYIRCNMNVSFKQIFKKYKYIDNVFSFMNKEFQNWKQHEFYFKRNKKNKKEYISKVHWKVLTLFQVMGINKILKINNKIFKKFRRYNPIGYTYIKYYHNLPLKDNLVLIDSQHGNDINGNMFYLIKEMNDNIEYSDFDIYLGVDKNRIEEFNRKLRFYNIKNVKLVLNKTKKYMKLLATAKFLFTDTSFVANLIKKDGQVYLNTWHGTPLKTLGRSTKSDFENIPNLQKNFVVADYLLYPSEYMMEHMLEDYMLDNIAKNKVLLCGYPRNSIFFNTSRREQVKKELNVSDDELIAYMPTWRGTLAKKDNDEYINQLKRYLDYISKNLNSNQKLYVNVHPYIKDFIDFDEYNNIYSFPKDYETYDFLNICDTLITDYSSVFFDFAVTHKKIILFVYDEKRYLSERGLYINLSDLPFHKVYTVEELMKEINNKEIVNYTEFLNKFCKYDQPDIPKKICEKIILEKETDLKEINMPNNGKENVLILLKNFSNKKVNKKFFELISEIEDDKYNYYVGYINRFIKKYSYNLIKLPQKIKYMGQLYSMCNISFWTKIRIAAHNRLRIKLDFNSNKYDIILKDELKRIYGDIAFKTVIVLGEEKELRIRLFSKFENAFKILYNCNQKNLKDYKGNYDYLISEEELNKFLNLNDIVELGEK